MTTKLLVEDMKLARDLHDALDKLGITVTLVDKSDHDAWLYRQGKNLQVECGDWGGPVPEGTPDEVAENVMRFITGREMTEKPQGAKAPIVRTTVFTNTAKMLRHLERKCGINYKIAAEVLGCDPERLASIIFAVDHGGNESGMYSVIGDPK